MEISEIMASKYSLLSRLYANNALIVNNGKSFEISDFTLKVGVLGLSLERPEVNTFLQPQDLGRFMVDFETLGMVFAYIVGHDK